MIKHFIYPMAVTFVFWLGSQQGNAQALAVTVGGNASGQPLAAANAGADIAQGNPTFTMAATTPSVGTGAWSLVSGTATITTPSSATTTVTGIPLGTSATLRWTITEGSCSVNDVVVLMQKNISLSAKVLLEGPFSTTTGLMNDALRTNTVNNTADRTKIPLQQPYNTLSFGGSPYNGTETITMSVLNISGSDAIIDWVLVELRDPTTPATFVTRRAALVQADGDIVDTDGVSPVTIEAVGGAYHIAIRHRNHLAVRTKNTETFAEVAKTIDFTNPSNTNVLTNGSVGEYWKSITYTISGTTFTKKLLNTGDANRSGTITGLDKLAVAVQNSNLTLSYFAATADFNLSGVVTGADKLKFSPNNGIIQPNLGQ